jgi:rare lipoprotein A
MKPVLLLLGLLLLNPTLEALAAPTSAPTNGIASWYGNELKGRLMANQRPFDPTALTCASWNYPFGARLRVHYQERFVDVTVTDRGPNKRLHRLIDLSKAAFKKLADPDVGLIQVNLETLPSQTNHVITQSPVRPH